ncbi:PqiB family protein [Thalassotalea sp. PS06]|uniref:PqiB family protein n=1 Tax=Thalassotalea sp. PS06 TaxID=2594005 RepID=UPI00163D7D9A|nr:MlaD family protein [Thalassotalea sp. PS06]
MSPNQADTAIVEPRARISFVWILPILAAFIAIYLLVQAYYQSGVDIKIFVKDADGIVEAKTEVRFKGLPVGLVRELTINSGLDVITVEVEMDRSTKPYLNSNSQFWLVKPEISLSGVSGLETVITGNYFEMLPADEGERLREFYALDSPPAIPADSPGLHLTLHAQSLGSLNRGSGVYYKQIRVGEVYDYQLIQESGYVAVKLLIDEQYKNLVKFNSRFYNASGVEVSGDLSGFKVRTESFSSIISGGIAFHTPITDKQFPDVEDYTKFNLYDDFDAAQAGIKVTMNFPQNSGVKAGETKVIFEGVELGVVEDFTYNQAQGGLTASVNFDPRLEPYLLSGMEFWLVKPKISLSGISNLDRLLSGPYVSFRLGSGEPTRVFNVKSQPPPLSFEEPGLHLQLQTENIDSLGVGTPIFYRNMRVGSVQENALNPDKQSFSVHIFILPEYEYLVNETTRFFKLGGIDVQAKLPQIRIEAGTLTNMFVGGIGFVTDTFLTSGTLVDGHKFNLADNEAESRFSQRLQLSFPGLIDIYPDFTLLKYQSLEIGKVNDVELNEELNEMQISVVYDPKFKTLFREHSQIRMVTAGLSAKQLNAMVSGSFLEVLPGHGEYRNQFEILAKGGNFGARLPGLQLRLTNSHSHGLKPGAPVIFKDLTIGQVEAVNLKESGRYFEFIVTIQPEYHPLVFNNSEFYLASGLNVEASLSGVSVSSPNLERLVNGGISLVNPMNTQQVQTQELSEYPLLESVRHSQYQGPVIEVLFNEVVDIKAGAPLIYQGHEVGVVTQVILADELTHTKLKVKVSEAFPKLTQQGAQYFLLEPSISLTQIKNASTLLGGNQLGVVPGDGQLLTEFTATRRTPIVRELHQGLNLTLAAPSLGSVATDQSVYFRQIPVGRVLGSELNNEGTGVLIYINIESEYANLVSADAKFYNVSGIDIDAGLFSGVSVSTESISTILAGGVAFTAPEVSKNDGISVKQHRVFDLHQEDYPGH